MKKRILWLVMLMMLAFLTGCMSEVTEEESRVSIDYSTAEGDDYIIICSPVKCTVKLAIEIEYKGNTADVVPYEIAPKEERHSLGCTRIRVTKTMKMKPEEMRILHTSDVNEALFQSDNSRILSVELISQEYLDGEKVTLLVAGIFLVIWLLLGAIASYNN